MAEVTERSLGWKPQSAETRLQNWKLRHFMSPRLWALAAEIQSYDWPIHKIDDQGDSPECVGYAWNNNGVSAPVEQNWDNSMGHTIYQRAKFYDGDSQDGSTTLSGVKAFKDYTNLENNIYAWAQSEMELRTWLLTKSPVVVGTWWYYDMMKPDANGLVQPTGGKAGGHEWLVSGYDAAANLYHCTNSWGAGWGINGQFYISPEDLARLLADEGDACTCVEIGGEPPVPPEPNPEPGCLAAILGLDRKVSRIMKHFHIK